MNINRLFRKKSIDQISPEVPFILGESSLSKTLRARDLTALGIAAIVGAGIFSTIGQAASNGGPAVIFLFIFTAIACGFSAMCYAQFASSVPNSGSAYSYAYVVFGEMIAWIIGWDLLLEYAIGNIVVAISWSDYFTNLVNGFGWNFPSWLSTDYFSAKAYSFKNTVDLNNELVSAWSSAPSIFGFKIIFDLPALVITFLITMLVYRGINESRKASNLMVILKLVVIFIVIVAGSFYVNPSNWSPFAPNGIAGVLKGVSGVFFAYIGFDAISTTTEECVEPEKDMPKGIFGSLIICTILYVLVALILTGIVKYDTLAVGDPLAFVFDKIGVHWIQYLVSVSAIIAVASVLLVFQIGQPRIWMAMSKDGLLPKVFAKIHPKFKSPSFSTVLTGFLVGIPTLFINQAILLDMTSIGTLFAFVLVSSGVLFLKPDKAKYKVPYLNSRFILPTLTLSGILIYNLINSLPFYELGWVIDLIAKSDKSFPYLVFVIILIVVNILAIIKNLSLIPVLGVLTCLYLMTELGNTNWIRFGVWLLFGLVIYFLYGFKHSKLNSNPSK